MRAATGEPNAQAEDQIGRQKALQGDGDREGDVSSRWQAPRHDQADEKANSSAPRHPCAVQDRRRQYQEVLLAERLTFGRNRSSTAAYARRIITQSFEGDRS